MKSINVTREQSWAVCRDSELGAAEGTLLSVPTAPLSLLKSTSAGTFLPPLLLGLQTPFSLNFSMPMPPKAAGCARSLREAPALLSGLSTELQAAH